MTFGDISFLAFLLGGLGDLDELLEYDSRRLGGGPRFFTGDLRLGVGDRPRFFTGDLRLGVREQDRDRPFLSVFFVALAVAAVLEVFFTGDVFRFGDFSARFLGFGEARGGVARFLGLGELSRFFTADSVLVDLVVAVVFALLTVFFGAAFFGGVFDGESEELLELLLGRVAGIF